MGLYYVRADDNYYHFHPPEGMPDTYKDKKNVLPTLQGEKKKGKIKIFSMPKTSNDHFSSTVYKMKKNTKLVAMRIFDLYITYIVRVLIL